MSVEIRAECEKVYAVISDLRRKAMLNPNVQVIRIELEGGEPVREGSVFYHRLQKGTRIFEYRSRCVRIASPRLFESRSETDPPFEVRVTLQPTPAGCRLTQEECLEITPALLDVAEPLFEAERRREDFFHILAWIPTLRYLQSELRIRQHERLAKRLTGELQAWLDAIKAHLEA